MTVTRNEKVKYVCPKCGQTWAYSKLEAEFSNQDGCCHECVIEDDEDTEYGPV